MSFSATLGLVVALGLSAGCTGSINPGPTTPSESMSPYNTPLARSTWDASQSAPSGARPGALELGSDNCIRLRERSGRLLSILWPEGWRFERVEGSGSQRVIAPKGEVTISIGEPIVLGGGLVTPEQYETQPCASGNAWLVVGAFRE